MGSSVSSSSQVVEYCVSFTKEQYLTTIFIQQGTSRSHPNPESPADIIDRLFACPVCFEKYDKEIIQCQSGHSVCEECSKRLQRCPQCNAKYRLIRNYALEDILTEIKRLKTTPEKIFDDVMYAAEARAIAESQQTANQQDENQQNANQQVENQQNENRPNAVQQNVIQPNAVQQNAIYLNGDQQCHDQQYLNLQYWYQPYWNQEVNNSISCQIRNCSTILPKIELRDHLYANHPREVFHINVHNGRSFFSLTFSGTVTCALDTNLGIFFLVFRIERQPYHGHVDNLSVTAWIQGICSNEESHMFYSFIDVEVDDIRATYHDYVHGASANATNIMDKRICLGFDVPADIRRKFYINGFLCLNKYLDNPRQGATIVEHDYEHDY